MLTLQESAPSSSSAEENNDLGAYTHSDIMPQMEQFISQLIAEEDVALLIGHWAPQTDVFSVLHNNASRKVNTYFFVLTP